MGTWKMSKSIEKLLRRMVLPNADLRCNASQAMEDPYWTQTESPGHAHSKFLVVAQCMRSKMTYLFAGKSASVSHSRSTSLTFEGKLMDVVSPWSSRANKEKEKEKDKLNKDKTKAVGKENAIASKRDAQAASARSGHGHGHSRSQSQPKLQIAEGMVLTLHVFLWYSSVIFFP